MTGSMMGGMMLTMVLGTLLVVVLVIVVSVALLRTLEWEAVHQVAIQFRLSRHVSHAARSTAKHIMNGG